MHVLVLDDDEAIIRLLAHALRAEHLVTAMTNPSDAVSRIAKGERFDVMFCDLDMPVMSGLEVYAAIARTDREQARRIVFLSAASREDVARLGRLPSRRLTKPFKLAELREVIDGFLPISLLPR